VVNLLQGGPAEIDMLAWMSRASLELIGQAGVGVSFDTLAETAPPSEYMLASQQLMYLFFPPSFWHSPFRKPRRKLMSGSDLFGSLS
jgi:hypothetical protein